MGVGQRVLLRGVGGESSQAGRGVEGFPAFHPQEDGEPRAGATTSSGGQVRDRRVGPVAIFQSILWRHLNKISKT